MEGGWECEAGTLVEGAPGGPCGGGRRVAEIVGFEPTDGPLPGSLEPSPDYESGVLDHSTISPLRY